MGEQDLLEWAAIDAEWRRCRREARTLFVLELAQAALAVFILVIVALCGIVAITRVAVASGAVALPLGLGLAVSLALMFLGLAYRARMSHELTMKNLFRLECARRCAAERANLTAEPYRGHRGYRASCLCELRS